MKRRALLSARVFIQETEKELDHRADRREMSEKNVCPHIPLNPVYSILQPCQFILILP
jgi:hypothetical protein